MSASEVLSPLSNTPAEADSSTSVRVFASALRSGFTFLASHLLHGLRSLGAGGLRRSSHRRLRVTETISLGDKRFLSIVRVDTAEFLIGGGTGTMALLAKLDEQGATSAFQQSIQQAWQSSETA